MHWSHPPPPADLSLLLGQLLEHSTGTTRMLERIDHRLEIGDHRMNTMTDRITSVEAEIKAHRREKRGRRAMPPAERLVKMLLPYVIALVTLTATGSADAAKGILLALLGAK